ncbi:MAG: hypothetical protein L6308_00935 [Candidatus Omnitrophica bacterium]|nr:hypothetical protein [Candidatus Omnitrophota bacterium]
MNERFDLRGKLFLTDILLITICKAFSTAVINMAFLKLRGNHPTALTATHPAPKNEFVSFFLGLAALEHYFLTLIKKFLGDNWFVRTFVHFTFIPKYAVVEGIAQHILIVANRQGFIFSASHT